jgi:predicted metalloprotease
VYDAGRPIPFRSPEAAAVRWQGRRESANVEDRRGMPGGPIAMAGGGGAIGLVILVIYLCMGGDLGALLQQAPNAPQQGPNVQVGQDQPGVDRQEDELSHFVSVVLADTEEVWHDLFRRMGHEYQDPHLVLFRDQISSACGFESAATGPFYCPGDQKVYLDLSFFDEMDRRLGAPGDFPRAYVIAHEVGHHVQNLLGVSRRVRSAQEESGPERANELSVRLELQADFLAGVWAHHAEEKWRILEEGDVEEAVNAAAAIGDDRLQRRARGYVVPESFTHGTSQQRVRWFLRGLKSGKVSDGDTFGVPYSQL